MPEAVCIQAVTVYLFLILQKEQVQHDRIPVGFQGVHAVCFLWKDITVQKPWNISGYQDAFLIRFLHLRAPPASSIPNRLVSVPLWSPRARAQSSSSTSCSPLSYVPCSYWGIPACHGTQSPVPPTGWCFPRHNGAGIRRQ